MADKSVKINTTKETPSGDVMGTTLDAMEEFDVNKLNDPAGSRGYNGGKSLGGK